MGDNKNSYFKYVNGKRRTRANIGAIVDEDYVKNRDIDKAEMLNEFFASVFHTNDGLSDPIYVP